MTDVTPQFAKLMVMLAEAFGQRLTEGRIRIYAEALASVPAEALQQAMVRAVQECNFFPTVAELRRFLAPTVDDAGILAWLALNKAAASVGAYQDLYLEDGYAAEALRQVFGSWPAFCGLEDGPALTQKRQEFLVVYRQLRRSSPTGAAERLPGLLGASGVSGGPEWMGILRLDGSVQTVRVKALPGPVAPKQLGQSLLSTSDS